MDGSTAASAADSGYSVVKFSTADYAPRQRLDAWREVYGRTLQKLEIEPASDEEFYTEATLRRMPGLGVNIVRRSAVVHNRRREFISHDDIGMTVGLSSSFEASQFGRTLTLRRGEAILLTGAEPAVLRAPVAGKYIHFRVPVRSLSPLVADLNSAYCRRIPAANAALRLLIRYIGIFDDMESFATPELRRHAVAHIHDLLALAIGAARDSAAIAERRGGRAVRLRAIKADIADRLDQVDLSVGALATHHRLAPRYVQRLFEDEGETFTGYVLQERLARARRLLTDPRRAARKISAIAFESGFGDLSYFNRTFRRRYGAAPSEIRAEARRRN